MRIAKASTALLVRFLLVDETDDETAETSKTPTVRILKVGATTFSTPTNSVTETEYGWYQIQLTSTEIGSSAGELIFEAYATGTDIYREKIQVTTGIPAHVLTSDVTTNLELSSTAIASIWEHTVETIEVQEIMACLLDVLTAKTTGGNTTTQAIRNRADTVSRILFNATVTPGTGDRSAAANLDFTDKASW